MSVDYRVIGQRIKIRRRQLGKTQDNLAEALSVSVGYISQLERGVTKISLDTLARISDCLGQDVSEFVSGVTKAQDNYLNSEIEKIYERMDSKQKRMLLEIASIIVNNK